MRSALRLAAHPVNAPAEELLGLLEALVLRCHDFAVFCCARCFALQRFAVFCGALRCFATVCCHRVLPSCFATVFCHRVLQPAFCPFCHALPCFAALYHALPCFGLAIGDILNVGFLSLQCCALLPELLRRSGFRGGVFVFVIVFVACFCVRRALCVFVCCACFVCLRTHLLLALKI